ncbi:hypothetical protein CORC01_13441 [Colletotrichum orchidophilum]|uniref:Proteolipid membrane potential modulator n=1 Tax=Colletotrichum orchidophilum TaxID=1209926 RepID=A0A1G4AQ63_9PEZI|nr:uncharacterized protein CORC01_13441 [Colletotrichum orchidophilum]OHE91241.1 hypothetical protein CORC01_13441 [Colletotrichum orchidophilum]
MSSTGNLSPASTRSRSTSLRSLWSGTQSTLKRILSTGLSQSQRTPSSLSRTASKSEGGSVVRYIITLPPGPAPPNSPRCLRCLRCRRLDRDTIVAIACPPVAVYRGAADHHVNARVGLAVVLTVIGWVPGVIYALLSAPEKPASPYYWHTSERSSSAVIKRPRRQLTLPSKRPVKRVV